MGNEGWGDKLEEWLEDRMEWVDDHPNTVFVSAAIFGVVATIAFWAFVVWVVLRLL